MYTGNVYSCTGGTSRMWYELTNGIYNETLTARELRESIESGRIVVENVRIEGDDIKIIGTGTEKQIRLFNLTRITTIVACNNNRLKINFIRQAFDKNMVQMSIEEVFSFMEMQGNELDFAGWMPGNVVSTHYYIEYIDDEGIDNMKKNINEYIRDLKLALGK